MTDLFDKCRNYQDAKNAMKMGIYPYFTEIASAQETEVMINGKKVIMLGSNSYLGLTHHPEIMKAAKEAIDKYGVGCAGSRFLNGTLDLHRKLEEKLAGFLGKEAAITFSTGFQANLGAISALVGKDDYVIIDKLDHASIIDGCRLSFGKVLKFFHNDMEDLERMLQKAGDAAKLIVVDGVFSMEGDICDLPNIVKLSKKYGARILVDDAHSVGVLGQNGRGTAEHFGLENEVDLIMNTFSKSFATIGGYVAGPEETIHYLKHHSRSLIFSASLPPPTLGTVYAALDIIQNEPERREKLWYNTNKMKQGFEKLGFNTGNSVTPIIPIRVGELVRTLEMRKRLLESEGVFVNPVVPPAVPQGDSLIRTSFMATHTEEQLDKVLNAFEKVGKDLKVI
ncbi:MAG TPA: aminotransferase class I/II-fold pyridoxal phosphate-dependent enzyme [Firmicutes bacterium]|nr:aminotransferase class I/II-fold pyridoxal phosphate-dependent enzyme [Bacillota bacterium]